MANLVSPGVQIQITDQSFYASSGQGTVPFIMVATAANKYQPGSTTSYAPGTIPANAGKLYQLTSQRDLLQTFGTPTFYSQAGTPQNGSEINEYGLYAAYQYLGIANTAYVARADIDLAQLSPSGKPPTGMPKNGDLWLDTLNTSYGIFRSNGNINSSLSWGSVTPTVFNQATQFVRRVQGWSTTNKITDINTSLTVAGYAQTAVTLVINGKSVVISTTNNQAPTLSQIVQAINNTQSLQAIGISADIFERMEKVTSTSAATVYNLRITSSDPTQTITLNINANDTIAQELWTALGFANYIAQPNYIMPSETLAQAGMLAVNAYGFIDNTGQQPSATNKFVVGVEYWECIPVITPNGEYLRWFLVGSTDTTAPGWGWREARPTVVQSSQPVSSSATPFTAGASVIVDVLGGQHNGHYALTAPTTTSVAAFATELNTNVLIGSQSIASVVTVGNNNYFQITDYSGGDIRVIDANSSVFGAIYISSATTFYNSVTATSPITTPYTGGTINVQVGGGTTYSLVVPDSTTLSSLITLINTDPNLGTLLTASAAGVSSNLLQITSKNGTYFSLSTVANFDLNVPVLDSLGIGVGYHYGHKVVYQGYSLTTPVPNTIDTLVQNNIWINTQPNNRGANFVVNRYNSGTGLWVSQTNILAPNTNAATTRYASNLVNGSIFVQYDAENPGTNPAAAQFVVQVYSTSLNGGWILAQNYPNITFNQSSTTPTGAPDAGTLWYSTNLQADVMVNAIVGGQQGWYGYRNVYPATDVNGIILAGTAPSTQSDGTSALVDNDLWLDTSDLENYPKIYRWDALNRVWNLIDNTDHVTSNGIIFADARPNADGTSTGSTMESDMVVSNYLDSDAPSALSYPVGLLLFNTRYSSFNVKKWMPNYLPANQLNPAITRDRWVTASGNKVDGSPYMGRHAQRNLIVQALNAVLETNQEIRSENNIFNLMAVPGYTEALSPMITLNNDINNRAFIVVDPPARLAPDATSISAWANNTNNAINDGEQGLVNRTPYAGVYYPWGLATNLDGNNIVVPPSTAVLVTMAFNDQVAYPWFPPAGFTRGLVAVLSSVGYLDSTNTYIPVALNQGQRDTLYSHAVNPIAFIPTRGLVVFGQKTLNPVSSALDRVNVARLVCYLNYNLDNLAKPFLFELNDTQTRSAVTRTFNGFLGDLLGLRALYDYAVICDTSNNTPARIDANELWIDVALAPERAIEFIYIPIRILNTGTPLPQAITT